MAVGLTASEVYNSIFNKTEEYNKFELYTFPVSKSGEVIYEKVKDDIEEDLDISDIRATDLQDEIIGPIIIEEYKIEVTKRIKSDKDMTILAG